MLILRKINSLSLLLRLPIYFFLGIIILYAVGRPIQLYFGTLYTGDRGPYLQLPAPTAMTIRWQTRQSEIGIVNFGLLPDKLTRVIKENEPSEEHELRLTGLTPGTRYYYNISSANKAHFGGTDYWFMTPQTREIPAPVRFVVLGDPGYPGPNQKKARDALLDWISSHPRDNLPPVDLLLTTGDNAYSSGTNKQFEAGFFEPYENLLRNAPVWPVYGNHDARRRTFFNIFSLPSNAESGGLPSGTEHYYSFDFNSIHFVILDTEDENLSPDSSMLQWLKQDLLANQQPWLIAAFHHPPYTKGSHDSDDASDSGGRMFKVRENILPVLEQAGVDLVFSGHSHMYERSHLIDCHYSTSDHLKSEMIRLPEKNADRSVYTKSPDIKTHGGTIYTVIGSSSKLSGKNQKHPVMAVTKKIMGTVVIDIKQNELDGYFISIEGTPEDQFSIQKSREPSEPFKTSCNRK